MNNLNHLIENFLSQYTFNNIDILLSNRKILKLDQKSLVEKLIKKNRGGYCFENNQYLYHALDEQGYDVSRSLGRVVYGGSSEVPRTHQVSIVKVENELYLVDVGFGPYTPGCFVPLSGKRVKAFNGYRYQVSKINEVDYQLELVKGEELLSLYQFDLSSYNDSDFKLANYYTNTHDESKFTTSLVLSRLTPTGVKFVSNLNLTILEGAERKDHALGDPNQFLEAIQAHFGLSYNSDELLELYDIVSKFDP